MSVQVDSREQNDALSERLADDGALWWLGLTNRQLTWTGNTLNHKFWHNCVYVTNSTLCVNFTCEDAHPTQ